MKDPLSRWSPEAAALLAAAVLLAWNLGGGSLLPSDDCLYSAAARDMARTGDLLTPTWQGRPLFEKGPVLYWMLAASRTLLGDGEAAARLPGVLAACAILVLVWRLGIALGLSRAAAVTSAAFVLASNLLYFNARRPMTDLPALLFGLGGLWAWVEGRRAAWTGVLLGLSALTKVSGPAPFVVALGVLQAIPRLRMRPREAAIAALCTGLVALPWHGYMLVEHGRAFLDVYVGYHLFERASHAVVGEAGEPTYLAWLLEREGPLSIVLAAAMVVTSFCAVRRDTAALAASALWVGAGLPLLLSRTALPHYLVACLPGAALSAGVLIEAVARWASRAGPRAGAFAIGSFLAMAAASFLANNARDLAFPDYGPGTQAICARLRAGGDGARLAGTCDLHDPCVSWYCDVDTAFYALDPGYVRAVSDIPALRGVVRPLDRTSLREMARARALLLLRPDRLSRVQDFGSASGVSLVPLDEAPARVLVEVRPVGD